jgi:parvulin-like peptidyl-prolyl isomerase
MAPKNKGKGKDDGKDKDEAKASGGKLKPATSINVRHILCEKHSKKEEALAKIREGAKFDDVARGMSEDKARAGMYYSFLEGVIPQEKRYNALFGLGRQVDRCKAALTSVSSSPWESNIR